MVLLNSGSQIFHNLIMPLELCQAVTGEIRVDRFSRVPARSFEGDLECPFAITGLRDEAHEFIANPVASGVSLEREFQEFTAFGGSSGAAKVLRGQGREARVSGGFVGLARP